MQKKFHEYFNVILVILNDNERLSNNQIVNEVIKNLKMSDKLQNERLKSGETVAKNRIMWAKTYLKKAGLISTVEKGVHQITQNGRDLLLSTNQNVTRDEVLLQPKYMEWKSSFGTNSLNEDRIDEYNDELTPNENIELSMEKLEADLGDEIINNILKNSPDFFEKLVFDLLVKLGYGGNVEDAAQKVGKSNDKGIDGIIKEDILGLNKIYVQAKRYTADNKVGSQDIRNFIGSLSLKNASKGVFITTSDFTKEALNDAQNSTQSICLINRKQLCSFLIQYELGTTREKLYYISKIDTDYFEE